MLSWLARHANICNLCWIQSLRCWFHASVWFHSYVWAIDLQGRDLVNSQLGSNFKFRNNPCFLFSLFPVSISPGLPLVFAIIVNASDVHCVVSSGVSQQEWWGELQQGGEPGEGLCGQIQARPQEVKPRPAAGVATPSQTHSAAQVQFPLAGIWPPNWKTTERRHFLFLISTFYWMMKIFFYRFSYFVRKRITQSEIVMQEPFILHRSCDLGTTVRSAG